jgi:phage tail sheath protein FI
MDTDHTSTLVSPPGTDPGVDVQTIIGAQPPTAAASTSIGAFIGRTPQGPVNQPTTLLSFADYQRVFGGLDMNSSVSYQARAFFNNGGTQAEVVRLYRTPTVTVVATLTDTTLSYGTYSLTFAPLRAGPLVQVEFINQPVGSQPPANPTAASIYTGLGGQLIDNPQLVGLVGTPTNENASLTFTLSYPATISGGGGTWSFTTKDSGGDTLEGPAAEVPTPTGTSLLSFKTSDSLTLFDMSLVANQTGVATVTLQPRGGTPISISYSVKVQTATTVAAATIASALSLEIQQSSAAGQLVFVSSSGAQLSFTYKTAVVISATETGQTTTIRLNRNNSVPVLELSVANPGAWGQNVSASVDTIGITAALAKNYGLAPTDLFNLTVVYDGVGSATTERFTAVTLEGDGPNRLDKVLANQSNLVSLTNPTYLGLQAPPAGAWAQGDESGVDSAPLQVSDYTGNPAAMTGLYAFNLIPRGFNILSIPPDDTTDPNGGDTDPAVYQEAAQVCVENNAMLIIDPPMAWYDSFRQGNIESITLDALGSYTAEQARACAVYFPRVIIADPLSNGLPRVLVPSGYIAAVWASVDTAVGVWKAPAGLDAPIGGILALQAHLDDAQNGVLNPQGINALRSFNAGGSVVWGARTLRGSDQLGDQYKYIPIQRTRDFISSSLYEDTQWAVFQPNDEALWATLTNQISTFMTGLFSQGAFAGTSAAEAFFVTCNSTTTTPADQAAGIVNVQVGFAPLYPAEFVVITISQQAASA